jgi:hypothetical protein
MKLTVGADKAGTPHAMSLALAGKDRVLENLPFPLRCLGCRAMSLAPVFGTL